MPPSAAVYACAGVLAAGLGYLLLQIPVQVSDCVENIATVFSRSWGDLLRSELSAGVFLRPLIHLQTKLVLEVAPGYEFAAFRGLQVAQVGAAFWLFARALRVRSWPAAAGAFVAIAVFSGSHSFVTLLNEGYPINNYLTVALCALVALNVATEPAPRVWTDAAVVAAFVLAAGTIESGLLVWVAVVAAAMAGCRGVSPRALVVLSALVAGYFLLRLAVLDVGTPGLDERASGVGLERLEPDQLIARFGDNPLPLYAYNTVSAASSVLLSEPRSGVVITARAWLDGALRPWMLVHVVSGLAMTALLGWYAWRSAWRRPVRTWSDGQRLLFIAAAVLAANAVMSYAYAKDQVMSTAAMFVAAAVAAPVAMLVQAPPRRGALRALAVALVFAASLTWSWRVAGVQHALTHAAFAHRNDWAGLDAASLTSRFGGDPRLGTLIGGLRLRAITAPTAYPDAWSPRFVEEWFGH